MSNEQPSLSHEQPEAPVTQGRRRFLEIPLVRRTVFTLTAAGALTAALVGKYREEVLGVVHGNILDRLAIRAPTGLTVFPSDGPLDMDMNGVRCRSKLILRYDEGGNELAGATIEIELSEGKESMFINLGTKVQRFNVSGDLRDPTYKEGCTPERKAMVEKALTGPDGVFVPPTGTLRSNAWNGVVGPDGQPVSEEEKVKYVQENLEAFTRDVMEAVWQLADARDRLAKAE